VYNIVLIIVFPYLLYINNYSKFKAAAKELQTSAEKIFEYEKRANQEININRAKVFSPLSPGMIIYIIFFFI